MSIIIIGIGEADFDTMQGLDSDGGYALSVGHKSAKRDIVQFVPFNQHRGNSTALAAEVLKELPDQICEFMTCGCCFSECLCLLFIVPSQIFCNFEPRFFTANSLTKIFQWPDL